MMEQIRIGNASRAIVTSLLLLITINLFGQSAVTISGSVQDAASQKPLPFANILVTYAYDSSRAGASYSLEDGRFTVNNLTPGNYRIVVSSVSYEDYSHILTIGELSPFLDIGKIELKPSQQELAEVMVQSDANFSNVQPEKKLSLPGKTLVNKAVPHSICYGLYRVFPQASQVKYSCGAAKM